MDDALPIAWVTQKDDTTPQITGEMLRERVYVFYLGKFGPFTERVTQPVVDDTEIRRRIDALRVQLRALQRA